MKNRYKIIAMYDNKEVHVIDDMGLDTKTRAKAMIYILKLVNPLLTYKIKKIKETP